MFQSNAGPSFPAHAYLVAGTSVLSPGSRWYVAENLTGVSSSTDACDMPPGTKVELIDPLTGIEGATAYPCMEHQTLFDLIDAAGLAWRYYEAGGVSASWDGPDAVRHIRNSSDYENDLATPSQFLTAIHTRPLASVTWITPTAAASDHAFLTDGSGPSWVAAVVNAIGQSPYWSSTAIFITWDDWGGWYDHVSPPQYNYYELGFRVPLIVVSPYAKRGYVSHIQHEFGSILRFSEETLGLGSLGYTDARADDLRDCFDFNAPPQPYQIVPAARGASYFRSLLPDRRSPDGE